jgi:hypothetical protein
MKRLVFIFFAALFMLSCENNKQQTASDTDSHAHKQGEDEGDGIHYGLKKIDANGIVNADDIIKKLENKENLEDVLIEEGVSVKAVKAKIEGTITEMCKMSGCWFSFKTANNIDITVNMREHKSTPQDWSGKTVIVEGAAYIETVSIEELRFKAKEEGADRDAISKIKEPQINYYFLADGAMLKK